MSLSVVEFKSDVNANFTAPGSVMADWLAVGAGNYLLVQDAAVITNPATEIVDESRVIVRRDDRMGTFLVAQMNYNAEVTNVTSPIIKVFGRYTGRDGLSSEWGLLKNRLGAIAVPLVVAATDVFKHSGASRYTTVDADAHFFDTQGYNEFLIGVETAFDGDDATDASLQVKFV